LINGMIPNEIRREVEDLRERILQYQREYYIEGRPSVSDREYDRLFDRLLDLENRFPELKTPDSPTHRVGSDLDSDFPEVRHTVPVLSLDKAYSPEEVFSWMEKVSQSVGRPLSFVLEEKIDGVSIVLYYREGYLYQAVTRGNGYVGNDVTPNVKTIRQVPLHVSKKESFFVRGEIYLPVAQFEALNATMDPPYANPRNLVGGALRRKKSRETARIPLQLFVYDGFFEPSPPEHWLVIEELKILGFPINPRNVFIPSTGVNLSEIRRLVDRFSRERKELPYQIDGLVFKVNELGVRDALGYTEHHPRWAIAYKFEAPYGASRVKKIEIQVGRTGRITPVARIEPVEVGGATIENVTLHNQDYIDALELSEGDVVAVSRRGDVIPAIEKVLEKNESAPLYRIPGTCPSCGAQLEERGAHTFCPNTNGCPAQLKGRLQFFTGKDGLDIDYLGEETIEFLWNEGLVRNIQDLYRIPWDRLQEYPGFGERKVELLRRGIEKSKEAPFERLLPALGIPEVGPKVTELLINAGYDSFEKLFNLADKKDIDSLLSIPGIGPKTAERIIEEFSRPDLRNLIRDLEEIGFNMHHQRKEEESSLPQIFQGQTWCVTGSFEHFKPRDLAMEEVKKRGGRVVPSVTGAVTHLLAGESPGSKLVKAKSLGVRIVTEKEFLEMLGQ
jgi:DNA ligase (NAD+)